MCRSLRIMLIKSFECQAIMVTLDQCQSRKLSLVEILQLGDSKLGEESPF